MWGDVAKVRREGEEGELASLALVEFRRAAQLLPPVAVRAEVSEPVLPVRVAVLVGPAKTRPGDVDHSCGAVGVRCGVEERQRRAAAVAADDERVELPVASDCVEIGDEAFVGVWTVPFGSPTPPLVPPDDDGKIVEHLRDRFHLVPRAGPSVAENDGSRSHTGPRRPEVNAVVSPGAAMGECGQRHEAVGGWLHKVAGSQEGRGMRRDSATRASFPTSP